MSPKNYVWVDYEWFGTQLLGAAEPPQRFLRRFRTPMGALQSICYGGNLCGIFLSTRITSYFNFGKLIPHTARLQMPSSDSPVFAFSLPPGAASYCTSRKPAQQWVGTMSSLHPTPIVGFDAPSCVGFPPFCDGRTRPLSGAGSSPPTG